MNPATSRAFRLFLLAYPAEFRRSYGDEIVRTVVDRHVHEGVPWLRLAAHEFFDAARVAPIMRWESPMNRIVIVAIAATVAAVVAVAVNPVALVLLAVVLIPVVVWWSRTDRPIESDRVGHRGVGWLAGGLVAVAVGVAIPIIDGGELAAGWWTAFALALLSGIAMTITGVILAVTAWTRPAQHPAR